MIPLIHRVVPRKKVERYTYMMPRFKIYNTHMCMHV